MIWKVTRKDSVILIPAIENGKLTFTPGNHRQYTVEMGSDEFDQRLVNLSEDDLREIHTAIGAHLAEEMVQTNLKGKKND